MICDEFVEASNGRFPNLPLHHWTPTQEGADGAERHARPAPEVEAVLVVDDEVVLELEFGVDDVVDNATP